MCAGARSSTRRNASAPLDGRIQSAHLGVDDLNVCSSAGNCHASQATLIDGVVPDWFPRSANASRNRLAAAYGSRFSPPSTPEIDDSSTQKSSGLSCRISSSTSSPRTFGRSCRSMAAAST